MSDATPTPAPTEVDAPPELSQDQVVAGQTKLVEEDLLVEDVSIDGMCGVY